MLPLGLGVIDEVALELGVTEADALALAVVDGVGAGDTCKPYVTDTLGVKLGETVELADTDGDGPLEGVPLGVMLLSLIHI